MDTLTRCPSNRGLRRRTRMSRRLKDDGKDSDDRRGLRHALETELKHCQQVERPAHHPADHRGARRTATCRRTPNITPPRSAVAQRGPHRRARGQARARRGDRRLQAVRRHHQVRRDRDAGRRGYRGEEGLADRRRARGRRQGGHASRSPRRWRARCIGKDKGANVEVVTPGGAKAYEVMKVEWR